MVVVSTTQAFLERKLANLIDKLANDFEADQTQLGRIHSYISVADQGIVQYVKSLAHMNLDDSAAQLVKMLHIHPDKRGDACLLVCRYLSMFMSVTDSLPA
jgi:hypothetical protein